MSTQQALQPLQSSIHSFIMEWHYRPLSFQMKLRQDVLSGDANAILELAEIIDERLKDFAAFETSFTAEISEFTELRDALYVILDEITS